MPQFFQVLKCYKCLVFQVHQTKKSAKWECKLCGEKQSIKRHYGLGSGKECRIHVQKLNRVKGEMDELKESNLSTAEIVDECAYNELQNMDNSNTKTDSKWSEFVEKTEEATESGHTHTMYLNNTEIVLEVPSKRRKLYHKQNFKVKSNSAKTLKQDMDSKVNINNKIKTEVNETNELEIASYDTPNLFQNTIKANISIGIEEDKLDKEIFVPYTVKKSSKWAQFTDTSDSPIEEDFSQSAENTLLKVPNNLFSLCDDNNIDDLLNI